MKKILFSLLFLIMGIFLYYFFNDSYRYSLEAKAYYEMGQYNKALILSQKAYKLDKYNRMAFTILTQSKIAKSWQKFIDESEQYFIDIDNISNKEKITKADKIRIKMMLEIIMGEYKTLKHSEFLNETLKNNAYIQYKKAKELYDGIFKKTNE